MPGDEIGSISLRRASYISHRIRCNTNLKDEFPVRLGRRENHSYLGYFAPGAELRGRWFQGQRYMTDNKGVPVALENIQNAGMEPIPTYELFAGRSVSWYDEAAWLLPLCTFAERDIIRDANGILGFEGMDYVLDIQNGGMFLWDTERIRKSIDKKNKFADIHLNQEEIDRVLYAIATRDDSLLKECIHGGNIIYSGGYQEFLDASAMPGFLGNDSTYVVARMLYLANDAPDSLETLDTQIDNPDMVIAAGGKEPLRRMLDQAAEFREVFPKSNGKEWGSIGSWHHDYTRTINRGFMLMAYQSDIGIIPTSIYGEGSFVGVYPLARDIFYAGTQD